MVTVVLISYLRPNNIQRIIDVVSDNSKVDRIVVSNNNPDINLKAHLKSNPKLHLIQQVVHYPPWIRFELAALDSSDYFISIDDDLFLSEEQVDALIDKLLDQPEVPHGVFGQVLVRTPQGPRLKDCITGVDREIDVLNRAYAYTRTHARNVFKLLEILGLNHARKIGLYEDVLLSFGSAGRPRCHDLGPLIDCESSSAPEKALHMKPGFAGLREQIALDIMARVDDIPWLGKDRCTIKEYDSQPMRGLPRA